jgi:UDPglucose--hexose-1-phosphate uridylyltransferase
MERPHRRYNPLVGEWILVSPQRDLRPWLGQVERGQPEKYPAYDPECYLCPGNMRAGGLQNPNYRGTFVFDNDFPALLSPSGAGLASNISFSNDIFMAEPVTGVCRVVCFSSRHDLTLPELTQSEVRAVVDTWTEQTAEISNLPDIQYVQVFENKGELMGCSNPHPHSQIWATSFIPDQAAKEISSLSKYKIEQGGCLICDFLSAENDIQERIVCENDTFSALVPFWAVWPFEILVCSRRHTGSMVNLLDAEKAGLADIIRKITTCYDNLFEISFPYSMGFHQFTDHIAGLEVGHLHAHYYPPLLRSAEVRKFMVGFEMLAMPQRDLTPEKAAARLRDLAPNHYRSR